MENKNNSAMNKDATAALRELAEKWTRGQIIEACHKSGIYDFGIEKLIYQLDQIYTNTDFTAHINEHYYPKEFVEWAIYLATDEDGTYSTFISVKASNEPYAHTEEVVFNSVEEAFKWWKENER